MTATTARTTRADRLLNGIERAGNKLPNPFMLFLYLFLITALGSSILAWMDVSVQIPGADEATEMRGFFTGEGLAWFTENLGPNYLGFPPLVTVLPIAYVLAAPAALALRALPRRDDGSRGPR